MELIQLLFDLVLLFSTALVASAAPRTCYSRIVSMRKEINHSMENMQTPHFTKRCATKLPKLDIDIHNSCVMSKIRSYLQAAETTSRRCQITLQPTVQLIKRLYIIMVVPCKAELVFVTDSCNALRRTSSTN
ncbi:cytokine-like protein 1 isoform X2 [Leucoraja erinacea]|uniref:cytokine-like protein 1 isoform X2 n=1 Tax=Leucoraja erinaceus TaxID=7782 RepID=UPI002453CEEA|nr:cytokine-like protein 1 isoform X2 [Leucoraja erinacea]